MQSYKEFFTDCKTIKQVIAMVTLLWSSHLAMELKNGILDCAEQRIKELS